MPFVHHRNEVENVHRLCDLVQRGTNNATLDLV